MSTEIILVEVNVYEKNLKELIAEYERINTNYISSLKNKNMEDANRLLVQLESMNQEIQLLSQEISQKIQKINQENKYGNYKNTIQQKSDELNRVYSKMVEDEKHINSVLHDMIDLDGKNESLRLQQKTSLYYIYFAIIVIAIISLLFVKFSMSTEQHPIENTLLILGILLLLYFCWNTIS